MTSPRVAFITNLCPYYRRPLFELLAEQVPTTFYFFSEGRERYLSNKLSHERGNFPVRDVRRLTIAGNPLLVGLQGELSRDRYDVVVKCLNGRLMVPYVYLLARQRRLPFVLWTGMWHHPQTLTHRLTRPLTEGVYRGADAIVTYGDHVKRFVESVPGVSTPKIYVAGQAIDPAPFLATDPGFDDIAEVLFVGQLEPHKGIDHLFTAFASIRDRRIRLRIAGAGSLEAQARAQMRLDSRIEVLGHVPQSDMPVELARARCLVLPAVTTKRFREAWGLVVNEAMAAGVPVIVTDAVGAAAGGLVVHERNGLVVPEGQPAALAFAINRLATDVLLARSLGAQARVDVAGFDYERMVQAFLDAIGHALDVSSAGAASRRGLGTFIPSIRSGA